jgi:hypothetical protein
MDWRLIIYIALLAIILTAQLMLIAPLLMQITAAHNRQVIHLILGSITNIALLLAQTLLIIPLNSTLFLLIIHGSAQPMRILVSGSQLALLLQYFWPLLPFIELIGYTY